jgi:glycosyltransferase involved in cell wall biosynthesis
MVQMKSIAFVTTSKGRLNHIKETLPLMAAQNPDEIIVVDYGCPDGTGDWVEANFPVVKVVRIDDDPGFCVSRARNRGAAKSACDLICFIDADIKLRLL